MPLIGERSTSGQLSIKCIAYYRCGEVEQSHMSILHIDCRIPRAHSQQREVQEKMALWLLMIYSVLSFESSKGPTVLHGNSFLLGCTLRLSYA